MRQTHSRRSFLVAGAAAVAAPHVFPSHVLGLDGSTPPSETVRVGIAGLGGRARWILLNEDLPGARIVAVGRRRVALPVRPIGHAWNTPAVITFYSPSTACLTIDLDGSRAPHGI